MVPQSLSQWETQKDIAKELLESVLKESKNDFHFNSKLKFEVFRAWTRSNLNLTITNKPNMYKQLCNYAMKACVCVKSACFKLFETLSSSPC